MAIELDNSFTVPVPPEQAWDVLLDVERIAPCMPGASVLSVEGDVIEGQVKVKLGPLSLSYKGTAEFTEKDAENRALAIKASGKETRGAGTASATVNVDLKPGDADGSTLVAIHTSLNVTGRPAQFGRSLLPEVSGKLIGQFADNLDALIQQDGIADTASATAQGAPAEGETAAGDSPAGTASAGTTSAGTTSAGTTSAGTASAGTTSAGSTAAGTTSAGTARTLPKQEESLNVVKLVAGPLLKRILPAAAIAAAVALGGRWLRSALRKGKA